MFSRFSSRLYATPVPARAETQAIVIARIISIIPLSNEKTLGDFIMRETPAEFKGGNNYISVLRLT
jgi:hypothetical protein